MLDLVAYIIIVALSGAFVLALLNKWRVLEWLQVHAPGEFLHQLFSCHFCSSWWVCLIISLPLWWVIGPWAAAVPVCSTMIAVRLW